MYVFVSRWIQVAIFAPGQWDSQPSDPRSVSTILKRMRASESCDRMEFCDNQGYRPKPAKRVVRRALARLKLRFAWICELGTVHNSKFSLR